MISRCRSILSLVLGEENRDPVGIGEESRWIYYNKIYAENLNKITQGTA